jgi:8-oxo-dGTP pyrophosphatase MutT (NUDIX family)
VRAQEFVTELFQSGKDWRWSFQGSEEAAAVFQVGDVRYMFHAWGSDGEWEAEFKRHGSKLDRSQKFGLTGTGNSAEVMSTVVDIMRAFLEKYQDKIQVLTFSAKEDSRQGLYARMVKRLLPTWTMQQKDEFFTLFAPKQGVTESVQPDAAGCIIVAEDTGRWCLQQRSDSVSDPGVWSTWGGGREPGETLEQAVRRELAEEGGYVGPLELKPLSSNNQYATFIGRVPHEFEPKINRESKDWCWAEPDQLPEPLHPGLKHALSENFADGKVKGKSRPGRVKRAGASCNGSVTDLRARAKRASGEKARMYHWCANMKSGRNKNK